jgi:N-acyl-D-aspartate/D-glutamate deacylase
MHDIIIRGGEIVDGTGGAKRNGDVAIADGVITAVGEVGGTARRTIKADGALVTPGFIDVHSHYDGQFLWDERLDPSFSNGVTTVIAGNCGVGFAPARTEHHQMLIDLMVGVEDIPRGDLERGLDWRWESFSDYMERIDARRFGMDVGVQLAHGPLRVYAMGERAVRHETATANDLEHMARLVTEAMHAGALGFSMGRERGHRSTTGNPVPGTFAEDRELLALASAMGATGRGVLQMVPHGVSGNVMGAPASREERMAEHDLLVKLARAGRCPVGYALQQVNSDPADWKIMLEASRRANAEGLRVHPQVLPRSAGALMTLEGYHPFMFRPSYTEIAGLPLAQRLVAMRRPERRAAILTEGDSKGATLEAGTTAIVVESMKKILSKMHLMSAPLDYEPDLDRTVGAAAARAGKPPEEFFYDYLIEGEGNNFALTFATNYGGGNLDIAREMLADPIVISCMSDVGAHVKYVCDGAITTFQLAFWSRDRVRGPKLPLEFMVRKATSDCAAFYGLSDRGIIVPGKRADLNVIDFNRLNAGMPTMTYDLPSGGGRLLQKGTGYLATLVAGNVTRENDMDTEARPGRLLRSAASQ